MNDIRNNLVSVIIPCYNAEAYIAEAIDSALSQTYPHDEVIVVDDASTDNSLRIIRAYEPRIRVVANNRNMERAWSRNRGISEAKGEFIAFLDADDVWQPNKLLLQMAALAEHQDAGLCSCGFWSNPQEPCVFGNKSIEGRGTRLLLRSNRLGLSTVVVRRDALDAVGLFDHQTCPCEDYDLWLRLSLVTRFVCVPDPLVYYRLHEGQSSADNLRMEEAVFFMKRRFVLRHPEVMATLPRRYSSVGLKAMHQVAEQYRWSGRYGDATRCYLRILRYRPCCMAWWNSFCRCIIRYLSR